MKIEGRVSSLKFSATTRRATAFAASPLKSNSALVMNWALYEAASSARQHGQHLSLIYLKFNVDMFADLLPRCFPRRIKACKILGVVCHNITAQLIATNLARTVAPPYWVGATGVAAVSVTKDQKGSVLSVTKPYCSIEYVFW